MGQAFSLDIDQEGIGTLVFDLPGEKVNKFSPAAVEELESTLTELSRQAGIKALVIKSGKPGVFIAGADINTIKSIESFEDAMEASRAGHEVFQKLAKLPFPTIALIDGVCLGGGLEMALACDYRVVTDNPKTQLGLPEVNLGIIPGWGGTQRLPDLVGLANGLPMVLGGKPVKGPKAYKLNLADALVNQEFKDEQLAGFLKQVLNAAGRKKIEDRRRKCSLQSCLFEKNPIGRSLIFKKAKDALQKKTGGHYPAPLAALDVIQRSGGTQSPAGYLEEQKRFADLAHSGTSKNLIQIFFTTEALKKEANEARKETPRPIRSTAVLGGGVMGGGIAWLMSKGGLPCRIKDVNWDGVSKGFQQASKVYQKLVKIRKCTANEAKLKMHRITGGLDYTGFQRHDLVVEAVVENMDVKKSVLAELEEHVRDDCIICSNTSTFSITEMATALKKPERFVGMHFFNPVNRMPLVEIIPGAQTSKDSVNSAVALCQSLGKTPVVVGDCAGFLVNRILFPYLNEALHLIHEGLDFEYVDKVVKDFGMPMGPFVLNDEVGLDTACKAAKSIEAAYGERMKTLPHVGVLVEAGLLGRKSGKGFYIHEGKERKRNPEVDRLMGLETKGAQPSDGEIIDRLMLAKVNEAARCLEEGVVEKPEYLDMAMILGTGFPPFRGGPLRYADQRGLDQVVQRLRQLESTHGLRFAPAKLLVTMAEAGETFYK